MLATYPTIAFSGESRSCNKRLERLALALAFLGANTKKMATDNSGKYVPAAVARQWAEAVERGIDDLSLAIIAPPSKSEEQAWIIVPRSYCRREVWQLLRNYYDEQETMECEPEYIDWRLGPSRKSCLINRTSFKSREKCTSGFDHGKGEGC